MDHFGFTVDYFGILQIILDNWGLFWKVVDYRGLLRIIADYFGIILELFQIIADYFGRAGHSLFLSRFTLR